MVENRPLAVVTGASSGIGYELARQFAKHHYDLVVAAEDEDITAAAGELRRDGGHTVEAVRADLATEAGVEQVYRVIPGPVDALAMNAGRGACGDFSRDADLRDQLEIVDVNVRATVHLAKRVLPDMVHRGAGRALFTSSLAAPLPGTYQAVYQASAAFVESFAAALQAELRDTGVTVTALLPGPTDMHDPADVARLGYEALLAGRPRVIAVSFPTNA
ncbi:SDR family NAD(P)-dependent oxidoreductase [Cryptosporangium sp. NPDC051539]|uniref:SDR family NAD(P)-dependent oxidoreductase n=1 Tax=Cryptosporangium sp. NPDC051539 TaxID=3363962 RepID=UPI0037ACE2E0